MKAEDGRQASGKLNTNSWYFRLDKKSALANFTVEKKCFSRLHSLS